MINKVIKLNDNLINQIAAGEVVDNPSSVIKELIENSIDAKSKSIEIYIENGGKKSILINDDGQGMHEKDLINAFERFATSKIENQKDLENICTLGFRGEALPSIASVAKVRCVSARNENQGGKLIVLEGGTLIEEKDFACPQGTTIEVDQIFS